MAYIKVRDENPIQVLQTAEDIDKVLNTYPGTPWVQVTEVVIADKVNPSNSITRPTRVFVRHITKYYPSVEEQRNGQE